MFLVLEEFFLLWWHWFKQMVLIYQRWITLITSMYIDMIEWPNVFGLHFIIVFPILTRCRWPKSSITYTHIANRASHHSIPIGDTFIIEPIWNDDDDDDDEHYIQQCSLVINVWRQKQQQQNRVQQFGIKLDSIRFDSPLSLSLILRLATETN